MKISKIYVMIILITIIFALIGGCGNSRKLNEGPVTLRLLTEDYPDSYGLSDTNPMSLVVRYLIDEYEAAHDGISIELEMLPSAPEEREARLEELRTEIMSGGGPDIYLLQGSGNDALFSDATQAMRNGLFYDINTLYESDDGLGKEALVTAVMNAGAIGNARYILPLRYNFPMVYTTEAALKAAGLDVEKISTGVNILYDTLAATGDPDWTRYSWPWYYNSSLCVFPNIIDYETQTVSLSTGEVMEYLQRIQALSNAGITYPMSSSWDIYASLSQYPLNDGIVEFQKGSGFSEAFLYVGGLDEALDVAIVTQALDMELIMFPLRSVDGSLVANVTYWGAVGAGCEYPEVAYDFLRLLLMEDTQWEFNRPSAPDGGFRGRVAAGWPVRVEGSVESLWDGYRERISAHAAGNSQIARWANQILRTVDVTEADIPLMDEQIDVIRFGLPEEDNFRRNLMALCVSNDTAMDLEDLSQELIDSLQWHIAEG